MFYRYEVKDNNLYLYLSLNYEFSKELVHNSSDNELTRRTKNFILNNNINFSGNKVFLVINGIIVKTLDISRINNKIEILQMDLYYSNEYYLVKVRMNDKSLIEITLMEYLLGVLANEKFNFLESETLKALAILYRTYVFSKMNTDKEIKAYDEFISFRPISYYKLALGDNYFNIYEKIKEIIRDTDCLFLTYNDKYILPFIHFSNTGKTFYHKNYPYLSSVKSLWDLASPYYIEVNDYSYSVFSKLLNLDVDSNVEIKVIDIDSRDFIGKLSIDDKIFTGEEFKSLLKLKSTNIKIIINVDFIRIISLGYGNGLGLSLYGANELAKNGCSFSAILKYYFPKVRLNKYIKELS